MAVVFDTITGADLGQARLLCAVEGATPDAPVRLFFSAQRAPHDIVSVPGFEVTGQRMIGGGLVVEGQADIANGRVPLPLRGTASYAPLHAPQPSAFKGLRTALALVAGQSANDISDWISFHVTHHGLEAVLLMDRARPDDDPDMLKELVSACPPDLAHLRVVRFDNPLGQLGLGPESHPLYAPDAPGKDRMTPPAPDPWQAPLGEGAIFELVRALYLDAARAVLNFETSDLLLPLPQGTVFDHAAKSDAGVVYLTGQRVYPWGVRSGEAPGFGDHICKRFDTGPGHRRWCIDLEKTTKPVVWRRARVAGVDGPLPSPLPYVRCMALRHADTPLSKIAPKSALVEDVSLLDLMTRSFDVTPRRPPEEKLNAKAHQTGNRSGIVTCMKNEGPFILEWLAHHRAIGVEEFLVYSNDCTDGTDEMLALLQRKGFIHHRDNPYRSSGMKPQHAALFAANEEDVVKGLDWVIVTDVDEFINIHVGAGTLEDLYAATGDANMISMTWRLFGNGDVEGYEDRFITEQFTRCAPHFARKPHQAWGFKTAARNTGIFKKLGVHRPKGLRPQLVSSLRWVNGSGQPMPPEEYRTAWRSTKDTYGYDLVTLNHYALRSAESFLVKRDRGRVNHVDRDQGLTYWFRMNHNAEEDNSIQRRLPETRTEFDRLMADPEIAAAHNRCVDAHRAKISALRQTEKYEAFFAEITSERMQKLSRMLSHFGSGVFFYGPDTIPDEVLDHAGDPDFFFTVDGVPEAD